MALADVWREVYRIAKLQIAKTQFFFAWLITKCDSPQKTNQELQLLFCLAHHKVRQPAKNKSRITTKGWSSGARLAARLVSVSSG
ncbi:MAG: hypothetical protein DMG88_21525 [Acidobacteria bacterium]|nr:MAG: hypothetical protein DMG88_21525 [Acidobacteriota bacterium]